MCDRFEIESARASACRDWAGALGAVRAALRESPDHHWWWTQAAEFYGLLGMRRKEYRAARIAVELDPDCPLAQFQLGNALYHCNRPTEAIEVLNALIDRGAEDVGSGPCGEGRERGEMLVTDATYIIGLSYQSTGKIGRAINALNDYCLSEATTCFHRDRVKVRFDSVFTHG